MDPAKTTARREEKHVLVFGAIYTKRFAVNVSVVIVICFMTEMENRDVNSVD